MLCCRNLYLQPDLLTCAVQLATSWSVLCNLALRLTWLLCTLQTAGGSGAISAVQIKGSNSDWTGLHNLYGAEWELDNQPELPLDLHVVSDTGAEVRTVHFQLFVHTQALSSKGVFLFCLSLLNACQG